MSPAQKAKKRPNGLQIDAQIDHQRREWRAERIAWWVMGALLLAALLGLFGHGPLSRVHAGDATGLSVEYDRLQRANAPAELAFRIDESLVRQGEARLRIDDGLLRSMHIESIMPEPDRAEARVGAVEFVFVVAEGSDAQGIVRYRPVSFGRRTGRVSTPGAPSVAVDHFVYP